MDKLTDKIGNEYEEWGRKVTTYNEMFEDEVTLINDRCIFISSPTGSGKTYFILNTLLPYVISKGKKLLYLVNRKILKEQIENEFKSMSYEKRHKVQKNIKIETYQAIESEICKIEHNSGAESDFAYIIRKYADFHYVVCDECHYFLADSNFNTNTILSFRFVQEQFADKIRIFMSATIDDVKSVIIEDNEKRKCNIGGIKYNTTYQYGILYNDYEKILLDEAVSEIKKCEKIQFNYKLERDYSYVHINILANREKIVDIIKNEKDSGKWFIFVDSIKFGEKLKADLELVKTPDNEKRYTVVMIKADCGDDETAIEVVDEIVEKGTIEKADIVISTSVMDNGINIKDTKINHFVLLADTEVEFIQMLGRKRKDNKPLELYIIGQDRKHFEKRKQWVEKMLLFAEEYRDCLDGLIEQNMKDKSLESAQAWCNLKSMDSENIIEKRRKDKNDDEQKLIEEMQIKIMSKIFSNTTNYFCAKDIYYVYKGKLYLNLLSIQNLENKMLYYDRIIEEFDSGEEDAFLKEQLGWLGIRGREADDMIEKAKNTEEDRARKVVIETIMRLIEFSNQDENDNQDEQFKQPFNKDAATRFLKSIQNELLILLKNKNIPDDDDKRKYTKATKRGDRPISEPMMEYLRKYCKLPFYVDVKTGQYTFIRCERDDNYENVIKE